MQDTTELKKLNPAEAKEQMASLNSEWVLSEDNMSISREFKFKGYYKTIAFVNVLAWIAQEEKHHPDLEVNFGRVFVKFTTHDVDGISQNDFNCAKRVDQI
jgi:4a-hydroxytetrahydrobiopterin dehydratase